MEEEKEEKMAKLKQKLFGTRRRKYISMILMAGILSIGLVAAGWIILFSTDSIGLSNIKSNEPVTYDAYNYLLTDGIDITESSYQVNGSIDITNHDGEKSLVLTVTEEYINLNESNGCVIDAENDYTLDMVFITDNGNDTQETTVVDGDTIVIPSNQMSVLSSNFTVEQHGCQANASVVLTLEQVI